jgi:hypothetical protein
MAPEYSEILSLVISALEPLGFKLVEDRKFLCVLGQPGRFVVLEGEPYVRGAFGLGITHIWPTSPNQIFSLRLLMQIFNEMKKPSLLNQLQFLVENMRTIFEDSSKYEAQYRQLNGD